MKHPLSQVSACVTVLLMGVALSTGCGNSGQGADPGEQEGDRTFSIDWASLCNPILSDENIPLKDQCVVYRNGTFHIFASGAAYRTRDFKVYEGPFPGIGSPDVTKLDATHYIMVYQTRDLENPGPGDNIDPNSPENKYRRLYYRTSPDLVHWTEGRDLFPALRPDRNIDGALARQGDHYYLGFKTGVSIQQFNVARSVGPEIDGNWIGPEKAYAGEGCILDKILPIIGDTITRWAENFQFIEIDGAWQMIATARDPKRPIDFGYMRSHEPFIYGLEGSEETLEAWTDWVDKRHLKVPYEDWNTLMHANSGYLADWRSYDGHFYLFYAGTIDETEDGRGHGRIGVVRSTDLVNWKLPGEMD